MTQNNKHAVSLNPPKTHVSTAEIEARDLNCVEQCKSRLNLPKVSVMILAAAAFMAAICNENSACSCPAATVSTWAEPASNGKTNATLNWGDEMGRLAKVMKTYMIRSKVGHVQFGFRMWSACSTAFWPSLLMVEPFGVPSARSPSLCVGKLKERVKSRITGRHWDGTRPYLKANGHWFRGFVQEVEMHHWSNNEQTRQDTTHNRGK